MIELEKRWKACLNVQLHNHPIDNTLTPQNRSKPTSAQHHWPKWLIKWLTKVLLLYLPIGRLHPTHRFDWPKVIYMVPYACNYMYIVITKTAGRDRFFSSYSSLLFLHRTCFAFLRLFGKHLDVGSKDLCIPTTQSRWYLKIESSSFSPFLPSSLHYLWVHPNETWTS